LSVPGGQLVELPGNGKPAGEGPNRQLAMGPIAPMRRTTFDL
jgi:hypothetical protein